MQNGSFVPPGYPGFTFSMAQQLIVFYFLCVMQVLNQEFSLCIGNYKQNFRKKARRGDSSLFSFLRRIAPQVECSLPDFREIGPSLRMFFRSCN